MTLLITGIHGFVGSNLVESLRNKHVIYGLDIVAPYKDGVCKTFSWEQIDQLPESDTWIHLAGKAHDTKNQSLAEEYYRVNTELTQQVFDKFLSSAASSFIFFSTVKAAADKVAGNVLTEDVLPNPVGPYALSKLEAENYILSKHEEYESKGKKVYILRPCMIHGPGNKGNLNLLYQFVKKRIPWPLGAYENKRSFCSIDNITYVVDRLAQPGNIPNGIYQVADDEPLSTGDLIALMCDSLGAKVNVWKIPCRLIESFASLGDTLHLPLNNERLQKLTENYVVSNNKVKKALGIDKMPVSAIDGILKTLKSFNP